MSNGKLLLFDVDGTLIKSGDPTHFGAYTAAMDKVMGIKAEIPVEFTAGYTDRRTLVAFLDGHGFGRGEVESHLDELFEEMRNYYVENAPEDMSDQIIVGVKPLLSKLKDAGFVLGVISGGVGDLVWAKLDRSGLKKFFAVGAFGDAVEDRAKLVELAVEQAEKLAGHVFSSEDVIVVGDTPRDIACARDNGVRVVAVATGPYTQEELRQYNPDVLMRDLSNTEDFLQAVQ